MPRQKLVLIIVVAAVIAFAIGHETALNTIPVAPSGNLSQTETSQTSGNNNSLTVSVMPLQNDPTNKLYQVQGEYPTFPSATPLNVEINNFVGAQLNEFETNVAQTWQAEQATLPKGAQAQTNPPTPFQFMLSWEPAQLNNNFISIVVRIGADEGGANSTDILQTFNYNVAKQKDVSLGDLFPNQPNYLSEISSLCEQILAQQLGGASNSNGIPVSMIQSGTAPTPQNFADFTFANGLVTIYFQKYQVAPGALGEQHVTFAQAAIQ